MRVHFLRAQWVQRLTDWPSQYTSAQDVAFGTDLSNHVTISKDEHDHLVRLAALGSTAYS